MEMFPTVERETVLDETTVNEVKIFEPQSGITDDAKVMKMTTDQKHQNIEFKDQMPAFGYDVESVMDPTRSLQDSDDATLDNFFSRPIKIAEEEWGTGTTLGFQVSPWNAYFNNPRVINRIANYNLLKAKLHVKIVINGNGFQYGRAICGYLPLDGYDKLTSFAALVPEDNVQLSQLPHVYLDPTTSTGGEMTLPFFWFENYLHIPTAQWGDMGRLFFRSLNALKHANGATDQVTISVFAWASEVSMSVLTSQDPNTLAPQSGKESEVDEANKEGVISGPATAVAKVSNALAVVPPLRPFAMATSTAATAVASIAKQFGYCRPTVTENPAPRRLHPISALATTNVPDTAMKLTVDDKQELSIDPRIAGLGSSDPLSIKEIAKRESYLTKFSWNMGTAPETLLWNARIDPVIWAEDGLTPSAFHFPACAMAALPFKYWTGSMRFRFQIVCSAFHKGRIKVVYDPNILDTNEYNTNYLQIIDIADTQDFTLEFGNGQTTTLLSHHMPGLDSVTQMYSTVPYTAKEEGNGVVGVYVVNELTTPNSSVTNDIEINVFVSMGDDFEVFVPDDHFQHFVFKPQSGVEVVTESQNTAEPSAPQQAEQDTVGPGQQDNAMINMVYTGESILSFRTLLKRYNLWRREIVSDAIEVGEWNGKRVAFPFLRGNVTGAVDVTGLAAPYNYCNTVLLHWVVKAFQGFRGSIRYKMLLNNIQIQRAVASLPNVQFTVYVQRRPYNTTVYSDTKIPFTGYTSNEEAAYSAIKENGGLPVPQGTGVDGMLYANASVNPTVEFEVPYYAPIRFVPGKAQDYTTEILSYMEGYQFNIKGSTTTYTSVDSHVATGEDFQVYFWTGLPRMYYETVAPNP